VVGPGGRDVNPAVEMVRAALQPIRCGRGWSSCGGGVGCGTGGAIRAFLSAGRVCGASDCCVKEQSRGFGAEPQRARLEELSRAGLEKPSRAGNDSWSDPKNWVSVEPFPIQSGLKAATAAFGAQDAGDGISIPQKVVVPAVEGAGSGAGWGGGP
jgi:hypothetical protein